MKFVQREIFFTMLGNYGVGSYSVVPPDRFSIQVFLAKTVLFFFQNCQELHRKRIDLLLDFYGGFALDVGNKN